MDKEAQEKIALLHYCEYMGWDSHNVKEREWFFKSSDDMKNEMYTRAERTIKLVEELGYRKLPEGEPPLLGDEFIELWEKFDPDKPIPLLDMLQVIAQAQRESDINWMGL